MKALKIMLVLIFYFSITASYGQNHPRIYVDANQKSEFQNRLKTSKRAAEFVENIRKEIDPYVDRHKVDPEWIISRLQMYWNNKFERVYVNGMDFSRGEGKAPVPTVKFSGSRDWDTDYLKPALENIKPYLDDERGMYLQNNTKPGQPWEWVQPSETGHIIEGINRQILNLAEEASFMYWLTEDEKYARFASDIIMKYAEGMHYREPPLTEGDDKNALLMGLQTFEVIHEGVIEPLTVAYDYVYPYLVKNKKDVKMVQEVFRKWAEQEIKYGVPDNNWNMMQARFTVYLALALEKDTEYKDGKGQQYFIDQILNKNSIRQKALKDVLKNYDPKTAIWPEVAGYSIMVSDDLMEIYSLLDRTLNNKLLQDSPVLENALLANFNYSLPNDFTVAYGDAKYSRLRFSSFELLAAHYRKYKEQNKEDLITKQLNRYIENGAYNRKEIKSLFDLFFYLEDLKDIPAASSIADMVTPTFYSPNVSWIVQRNGHSLEEGMMVSKNASLGNHSHTNGINIELYAKGMIIVPDGAAGVSYWSKDHIEYYSRFPAHNTVVVDGVSDYRNMRGTQAFEMKAIYPKANGHISGPVNYTFSDVSFLEPSTQATQQRVTGTVRTSQTSGYFVDIFRSAKNRGSDKKHEYIFHSQGNLLNLTDINNRPISVETTQELSSGDGDLVGYDYFSDKKMASYSGDFKASFEMPSITGKTLELNVWMKGYNDRKVFTMKSPYSRALHPETTPKELYHSTLPTLLVQQKGEAAQRPFVAIIDAANKNEAGKVENVSYFGSNNNDPAFVGIAVKTGKNRIDYIFNDSKGDTEYMFKDGSFKGTYGIVSFEITALKSILLGNGNHIKKAGWEVTAKQGNAYILITNNENTLEIDADKDFKLLVPKDSFSVLIGANGQVIKGLLLENKSLEFNIPATRNGLFSKGK